MPKVGDRIRGSEIGKKATQIFVYFVCPDCGYGRWVQPVQIRRSEGRCYKCGGIKARGPRLNMRGSKNPGWKGGRCLTKQGYIRLRLLPSDPLYPMCSGLGKGHPSGYIFEHRYIMAQHLGRCLESWEVVHHVNGDKADNRVENLELLPNRQNHMAFTLLQQEVERLRERDAVLEQRIILLEAERVLQGVM